MSKSGPRRRRGPGRPPLEEVAQHRDALLDVATTVFLEDGYSAASTNEIARRAGASKTTLYRLFPSKAELFVAMMTRRMRGQLVELEQLIQHHREHPAELLEAIAVGMLTAVTKREQAHLQRVVLHERDRFPELASAFWEQTVGRFTRTFGAYLKTPAVKASLAIADAEEAADVFLSLVIGLTPTLAEMNLLSANAEGWIKKRARDRVEAFLKIYARSVDAQHQQPGAKWTRSGDMR